MEFVIKGAYLLIIQLERETILPIKFNFKIKRATIPLNGFGNNDCKTCISHLIKLPNIFSKKLIKIPYLTLKLKSTPNYG